MSGLAKINRSTRSRARITLAFVAAKFIPLTGCGPLTATVSGDVTIEGSPIEKGEITLSDAEGVGRPITEKIANGKFS